MNALPEDETPEAEPETPEPEPEVDPEDDPEEERAEEPAPSGEPEALTEKEINKRIDALEREKERHAKRVGEILQEEANELVLCEACEVAIPGFHYPAAMYPADSPQRSLYELLGGGADAQMLHPTRYVVCETCNGFGQVLTGARNDLNRLIVCPDCKAAGFHDREAQGATVVPLATANAVAEPSTGAPPALPAEDFLGRPFGHPNYGLMSTYLTPEQIARDHADGFGY